MTSSKAVIGSLAIAGALSALSLPVLADAVSYNYAGLRYVDQDLDDYDCGQDGLNVYGSLDIQQGFFGQASLTDVSGEGGCGSMTISASGGYRIPFNKQFDLYGTIGFESTDVDVGNDDSGLVIAGGLRGFIAENLEAKVELAHRTAFDGDTGINGGVAYFFTPQISATFDLGVSSEATTWGLGARMNF
ncbi:outer membrane beta-barrel protein [Marinimicrobium locisalis]|uniref:outer membrane beta-barrel protein n=1 Tax=Marinimicrobium locisalis TaxID=546022 RepID=UPI0032217F1C